MYARPEPTADQLEHALVETQRSLSDPRAVGWLETYYAASGNYAGSTFLRIEPNDPWTVTAADLFAVSLLNVKVGPHAARRIISEHAQAVLRQILHRIPVEANLATADGEVWDAADELYQHVKGFLGKNAWVTASKLCARKRSGFFPVRDKVVTLRRLGIGRDWRTDWKVYKHLMTNDSIVARLSELENQARADTTEPMLDPSLRILDAILWMSTPK